MPVRILALFAALLFSLPAGAAGLRDHMVSGAFTVAGKQIPLPAGSWVVAADRDMVLDPQAGNFGVYGSIRNLVLFRVEESAVTAFIEINTNSLPVGDGWGVSRDCTRTDTYAAVVRYSSGWDALCFFLHHTMTETSELSSAGWRAAALRAAELNLTLPPVWVTAGFRAANRRDVVDVRYSFSPSAWGVAPGGGGWADGAWHKDNFEKNPERVAFVQAVARWAAEFAPMVEDGLKRRLDPAAAFPWPGRDLATAPSPSIEQRLRILEKLHADGGIPREEYERQRHLLASGKALEPEPQVDAATIAFWKTAAYRPMVSTANLFIDYFWIGQPFAAGVLVVLQVVVNTTKFYFHELAWERYFGGAAGKRETARVIDFRYAGYVGEIKA